MKARKIALSKKGFEAVNIAESIVLPDVKDLRILQLEKELTQKNIDILELQHKEKDLLAVNKELVLEFMEKEKLTAELTFLNQELVIEYIDKEKRADELIIANKELAFQNEEKERKAAELIIANKELAFQNEEKEKRADELIIANKELESFTYISSHDLQEPLRKIQFFSTRILDTENQNLSDHGRFYFKRIQFSANRMQHLIQDLLTFSRLNTAERKFEITELNSIIEEAKAELKETIEEKHATINIIGGCLIMIIPFQIRQLIDNLIGNALKFSNPDKAPKITIKSTIKKGKELNDTNAALTAKLSPKKSYCHVSVTDNGIGFEPQYSERIFEVFQRLHGKETFKGTGIGLAIVKKIVENHNGIITATSEINKGAIFDIYLPVN